jgi:hypothetical protein
MQRNIIVKPWNIKPNEERFDLSIKDKPVKPSTPKCNKFLIQNPFFMSLRCK